MYDNITFVLHFWVKIFILNMSYWVESCKILFVWLFMMLGGVLSWSPDICLDHMFFVLIGDGQGVLGWLIVGRAKHQSLNPKSSITVYGALNSYVYYDNFMTTITTTTTIILRQRRLCVELRIVPSWCGPICFVL